MTLHISQPQYQRIQEILETAYPQEGCGVLVGQRVFEARAVAPQPTVQPPSTLQEVCRQVVQLIPVANAWEPGLLDEIDMGRAAPVGGSHPSNGGAKVNHSAPLPSSATHGAHDRYWIAPTDLLRIQTQARDQGLEILGIVHSHPDHPAVPSACDRRLAWPVYSYLIASVCGGRVVDMQSWRLNAAQQFEPEIICLAQGQNS
jgi:proteasome lid subunit RPN8/RPN11